MSLLSTQQTRYIEILLFQCCASVGRGGPALKKHWLNAQHALEQHWLMCKQLGLIYQAF